MNILENDRVVESLEDLQDYINQESNGMDKLSLFTAFSDLDEYLYDNDIMFNEVTAKKFPASEITLLLEHNVTDFYAVYYDEKKGCFDGYLPLSAQADYLLEILDDFILDVL